MLQSVLGPHSVVPGRPSHRKTGWCEVLLRLGEEAQPGGTGLSDVIGGSDSRKGARSDWLIDGPPPLNGSPIHPCRRYGLIIAKIARARKRRRKEGAGQPNVVRAFWLS